MQQLTMSEIQEIEHSIGHELPGMYRKLLVMEGYGKISPELEIYNPAEIRELYEPFFDDQEQLFNPYFPFGNNLRTQEIWIIDASAEVAASIWHETVPEDWPEEEWLSYDQWIIKYL